MSVSLEAFAAMVKAPNSMTGPVLPAGFYQVMSGIVLGDIRKRFQTQTSPSGMKWPKLKHKRPRGGDLALLDTGVLRSSIQVIPNNRGDGVIAFTNLKYARIHNDGGTIRPTKTKYLAIPLTHEATLYRSPREFPRRLRMKFGEKGGVMFEILDDGEEIVHYALAKSVKVPKREFMGVSEEAMNDIAAAAADWGFNLVGDIIEVKRTK